MLNWNYKFKLNMEEGKRMTGHIHKRLIDEQARMILEKYLNKEIGVEQGMNLLGLKRRQFFKWVKKYRKNKDCFTIEYKRNEKNKRH